MAFCENCGAQLAPDSAFCEKCGTRASAPAATFSAASPAKAATKVAYAAREIACMAPSTPGEAVAGTIDASLVGQVAVAAVGAAQKASSKKKGSKTPTAPAAPKKKRRLLPVIIGLVMVLAGGYAFLAWWPGFHTSTPPVSSSSSSAAASSTASSASTGSNASSAASASSGAGASGGASSSSSAAPSYSTSKAPRFADFEWYKKLPRLDKTPSTGKQIKDFTTISGGWKCMFLFDSAGEANSASREALNVYISGAKGNFSVVLDPYKIEFGNEIIDETSTDSITLTGEWSDKNGTLKGTGSCNFSISCFYSQENAQYALGRLTNASGEGATVLMVRP